MPALALRINQAMATNPKNKGMASNRITNPGGKKANIAPMSKQKNTKANPLNSSLAAAGTRSKRCGRLTSSRMVITWFCDSVQPRQDRCRCVLRQSHQAHIG